MWDVYDESRELPNADAVGVLHAIDSHHTTFFWCAPIVCVWGSCVCVGNCAGKGWPVCEHQRCTGAPLCAC